MSKFYGEGIKIKASEGADGQFYIDVTSDEFGTIIVCGKTPSEAIAKLLAKIDEGLEEADAEIRALNSKER